MKLIRATFSNFRLLRDLTLDFRLERGKKLVVIRAENESGKTTILNALQWGLYGDSALPRPRNEYRLHPIDWDVDHGERVPVTVEIEFETTKVHRDRSGAAQFSTTEYRLTRTTYDTLIGQTWRSDQTKTRLVELRPQGEFEIDPPDAAIQEALPPELREIFFTDGDRALSFIEGDVAASTKQAKVRKAIRNLLGLDLIEGARSRVKTAATSVNSKVKDQAADADLERTADDISRLEQDSDDLKEKLENTETQFQNLDQAHADVEKKIEESLTKGDRSSVMKQIQQSRSSILDVDVRIQKENSAHSVLFRSVELARDLLAPALEGSFAILDELRSRGQIPNATIPVLEDRLEADICICGEQLQGNDYELVHRRQHIQALIDGARNTETDKSIATNLYFKSDPLRVGPHSSPRWTAKFNEVANEREKLLERREALGKILASQEVELDGIPDVDITSLKNQRKFYREQRDEFHAQRSRLSLQSQTTASEIANARNRQQRLLRQQGVGNRLMAELEVAQDLETALRNAYDRLTKDELEKVSSTMNSIFMEMIVADQEQRAIIRQAEITDAFDIMVYGSERRPLNPDIDLNGASRRALTLAFILALTQVSEVEAPNVIDTPLGMMSGLVKASVLTTAIRESSQLILFLTHSEIEGCQDILDQEIARIMTLTNPAHYPTMLVNTPQHGNTGIVRCECNHQMNCQVCERKATTQVGSTAVLLEEE